jgi:uncharacterized protein (DUF2062 family)
MKKEIKNRLSKFFKSIYKRLFLINDTPQKISLGFGLGVFLGVMPGMGPLAALVLASFFRLNRSAAFLGSLLLNTWINFVTLVLAIKIGSAIMGLNWHLVYNECLLIFNNFHFAHLFKLPILKITAPLLIGYFIIATGAAIIAYAAVLTILKIVKNERPQPDKT